MTTGRVQRELALRLGLTGMAARASGVAQDLRVDQPLEPYRCLDVRPCVHDGGDVAARVAVRFDEIFESLRLIRRICDGLPAGPVACGPVSYTHLDVYKRQGVAHAGRGRWSQRSAVADSRTAAAGAAA